MKTIYRHDLGFGHGVVTTIHTTKDAKFLNIQYSELHQEHCLWTLQDTAAAPVMRKIVCYWTGKAIYERVEELAYVGMVQRNDVVYHYFELLPTP